MLTEARELQTITETQDRIDTQVGALARALDRGDWREARIIVDDLCAARGILESRGRRVEFFVDWEVEPMPH